MSIAVVGSPPFGEVIGQQDRTFTMPHDTTGNINTATAPPPAISAPSRWRRRHDPGHGRPLHVYAPDGATWQHFHVARWARWMRQHGYRGRLPDCAVTICSAVCPAQTCRCGMYSLIWKEQDDGGNDSDRSRRRSLKPTPNLRRIC